MRLALRDLVTPAYLDIGEPCIESAIELGRRNDHVTLVKISGHVVNTVSVHRTVDVRCS